MFSLGWSAVSLCATEIATDEKDKRLIRKQMYILSLNFSVLVWYRKMLWNVLLNINNQKTWKVDSDLTWSNWFKNLDDHFAGYLFFNINALAMEINSVMDIKRTDWTFRWSWGGTLLNNKTVQDFQTSYPTQSVKQIYQQS